MVDSSPENTIPKICRESVRAMSPTMQEIANLLVSEGYLIIAEEKRQEAPA